MILDLAVPFFTLCALELVLGIDNVIFISILSGRLPPSEQNRARTVGLSLAVITRIGLLLSLSWVMSLTEPLFKVLTNEISGRDLILLFGGLFLLGKSTLEIHHKLELHDQQNAQSKPLSFSAVIFQILILDIVFSLDSVITAVGMVDHVGVMIAAVIVSTIVMVITSGPISRFVDQNPTIKMLALSFLILIGVSLIAEALDQHIPKGYIYFAMFFSFTVEMLNLRLRNRGQIKLNT